MATGYNIVYVVGPPQTVGDLYILYIVCVRALQTGLDKGRMYGRPVLERDRLDRRPKEE